MRSFPVDLKRRDISFYFKIIKILVLFCLLVICNINITGFKDIPHKKMSEDDLQRQEPISRSAYIQKLDINQQNIFQTANLISFSGIKLNSDDTDGDGIPDEWEIKYGLNISDPNDVLEDPDYDGLTNLEEYKLGLDPTKEDTDDDGLTDNDELVYFSTFPDDNDTDNDAMSDGWEIRNGYNPRNPRDAASDSDMDGLTNLEEFIYNTYPRINDTDFDGLSDGEEINLNTDPLDADTDNDGMDDGWEVQGGLDPLNPNDSSFDNDGDGLSNLEEFAYNIDPSNIDSDNDGMPDGWEVKNGFNPRDARDASDDRDNDYLNNKYEYFLRDFGFNPQNSNDVGTVMLILMGLVLSIAFFSSYKINRRRKKLKKISEKNHEIYPEK